MSTTLSGNSVYTNLSNMILNLRVDPHELGDFAKYDAKFSKQVEPYAQYFRIINTDGKGTYAFTGDTNILSTTYPAATEQIVELDKFRQLEVSYEHFRSKAAFGTATIFSDFVSSVTSWVSDTYKLFMGSVANVFLGVTCKMDNTAGNVTNTAEQTVTLSKAGTGNADAESLIRLRAGEIAEKVQEIIDHMKDARSDYNALGYTRATSNPIIIWNEKYVRKLLKKGLQGNTLYNTPDFNFENVMPDRFFKTGAGSTAGDGSTVRSAVEATYTKASNPDVHCWAGQLVPSGYTCTAATTYTAAAENAAVAANDIVCLILDPEYPIILHGETADTSFENMKAHINTAWKTWSYGLGQDNGKAFVRLKVAIAT